MRNMLKLACLAAVLLSASSSFGAVLARYRFEDSGNTHNAGFPPNVYTASDLGVGIVSASSLSHGTGINPLRDNGGGQNLSAFRVDQANTGMSVGFNSNSYFEFQVTTAGTTNFTSFSLDYRNTATNSTQIPGFGGAVTVEVRSSTDSYGTVLGTQLLGATGAVNWNFADVQLSGPLELTGPVTFRVFVYRSGSLTPTNGELQVDNLTLNGELPEPASLLAWAGLSAVGGVLALRRRKACAASL